MIHMREFNAFERSNVEFLVDRQVKYASIEITDTGLRKSILDATGPVRTYFVESGIHNYDLQAQGPENKKKVPTYILTDIEKVLTESSLYRPVTKKGDPRMWVYKLTQYVNPFDIFILIAHNNILNVVNISRVDIKAAYNSKSSPIRELVDEIYINENSIADELRSNICTLMGDWVPSEVLADTGIGRTVESLLGIGMNDSPLPDYKGIELKSKRDKARVRNTLFTQAPDWTLSKLKGSKAIVEKYGYIPTGYSHKALHVTLSSQAPNPQGLGLSVNYDKEWLEANEFQLNQVDGKFPKVNDVAVWTFLKLHERLLKKHNETFWIDVDTKIINQVEYFRVKTIEHTKHPLVPQFDTLLDQGNITVDFLLCRDSGGDTYSFKIKPKARRLLFPQSELYQINE